MDTFFWGMIIGAAVAPFAWHGAKWCFTKYKGLLSK